VERVDPATARPLSWHRRGIGRADSRGDRRRAIRPRRGAAQATGYGISASFAHASHCELRLGLVERRRVAVRVHLGWLADHPVQRPEPAHVVRPAPLLVDAADGPRAAVDGEVLWASATGDASPVGRIVSGIRPSGPAQSNIFGSKSFRGTKTSVRLGSSLSRLRRPSIPFRNLLFSEPSP
jgi:hypothetical protein